MEGVKRGHLWGIGGIWGVRGGSEEAGAVGGVFGELGGAGDCLGGGNGHLWGGLGVAGVFGAMVGIGVPVRAQGIWGCWWDGAVSGVFGDVRGVQKGRGVFGEMGGVGAGRCHGCLWAEAASEGVWGNCGVFDHKGIISSRGEVGFQQRPFAPQAWNEPEVYESSDVSEDDQAEFELVRPRRGRAVGWGRASVPVPPSRRRAAQGDRHHGRERAHVPAHAPAVPRPPHGDMSQQHGTPISQPGSPLGGHEARAGHSPHPTQGGHPHPRRPHPRHPHPAERGRGQQT